MKLIEYKTLPELEAQAREDNQKLYETDTSWSYRIFTSSGAKCIQLHIFKK